ncbi:MAG: ATP-binding cassette domain-containing protein [Solirubrobacterales bacterium]
MAVIAGSDLQKDVAGRPLLQGVSFRLERGQRMTVAGRNGAGKTTLLRMLAALEAERDAPQERAPGYVLLQVRTGDNGHGPMVRFPP